MMPRDSDGKMRRGGSKAARTQHQHPVDERGRVHGAPELSAKADKRVAGKIIVVLKTGKEKRRWGTRRQQIHALTMESPGTFFDLRDL
jgi:hypothetical protein